MEAKRLEEITATPAIATTDDLDQLIMLAEEYPYAHYLRILISKVAQHVHDLEQINKLNTAAVYSADRNILKKVITDPDYTIYLPVSILSVYNNVLRQQTDAGAAPGSSVSDTTISPREEAASVDIPDGDEKKQAGTGIFGEVMKNLDKLRTLRKKYSFLEKKETGDASDDTYHKPDVVEIRSTEMEESASPMPTSEDMETEAPPHMPAGNADEGLKTGPEPVGESDHMESLRKKQEKKTGPVRDLRYQQDLIDQFINSKPTISKQQDPEQKDSSSQVDLTLETPELEGDVVSETLARIFVKQGKLEKARDIYKKLIWKYPQKKAYFAAQIKDLKG